MALKVYAPGSGLDEDGVQLFSSEFELVFDLNHTNLLRPSHFSVCERSPYLLMPFSEHGSVCKFVGKITEADTWNFLHDVAAGLNYLHAQDPTIIHQDIKPDNVLIDHAGNYLITDFGISTKVRSTLRKSMSSNVKSAGTMGYMPPERFGKDNTPIMASDIWAVGAAVFELLTGDLPFGEHGGLMQKGGAEIPYIQGEWSEELQEVVVRCLSKEPWNRPVAKQIVEWTNQHAKGEKIIFDLPKQEEVAPKQEVFVPKQEDTQVKQEDKAPSIFTNKKVLFGIAGGVVAVLLAFVIIKFVGGGPSSSGRQDKQVENTQNDDTQPPAWVEDYNRTMNLALTAYDSGDHEKAKVELQSALALVVRNQDDTGKETTVKELIAACDKAIEEKAKTEAEAAEAAAQAEAQAKASSAANATPASPPAWLATYDRILNDAASAYSDKDYAKAKTEYTKALNLANQNKDRQKITFVNQRIAECDKAVEASKVPVKAATPEEVERRLAAYDFVGSFALGSSYMVVQKKSDKRWGIIDKEGKEVEAATYSQVSSPLKNGYYALKNDKGWVVFDTSLNKVATGLAGLNDY